MTKRGLSFPAERDRKAAKGITIHYHVGDHHYEKEVGRVKEQSIGRVSDVESSTQGSVGVKPAGSFYISRPLAKYRQSGGDSDFFIVDGSNS